MSKLLQIFILSRDRAIFLKESIDSAIDQSESNYDYEIIVSDNSETDDVNELVNEYYLKNNKITYVRRSLTLTASEHIQLVISEINAQYAVIFHDDDILHPDYIKKMTPLLFDESIIAVGCNAMIFNHKITDSTQKTHIFNSIKKFNFKKEFLHQYLLGYGGVAPFSGYIYKADIIKKISFESLISGKHFDVSFLASLLDYGSIAWLPDELMYYRVHEQGDSATESIVDRLHLLKYMFSEGVDRKSKSVFLFRYLFWLNWIKQQGTFRSNVSKFNYRIVFKFLVMKSLSVIISSYFWNLILKKMKKILIKVYIKKTN